MTMMRTDHRQVMTSALLRILKAATQATGRITRIQPAAGSWAETFMSSPIAATPSWNGNKPAEMLRSMLTLGLQTGVQNGLALYELSRGTRALSMPLAALTRASVEAYGRAYWVLEPTTAIDVVARIASLEHSELEYPERFGASVRRLPLETVPTHAVDGYRRSLRSWAAAHGLKIEKIGYSRLAIHLLDELHEDGARAYSEFSATAHGLGWAAANFLDFDSLTLQMRDQQLMDYCMTVLNATRVVVDRVVDRFGVTSPDLDRWQQARNGALAMTSAFVVDKRNPAQS